MNVTVSIISRSTMDQPFTELVAPVVVALTGAVTGYTPTLPPSAEGQDMRLRVKCNDNLTILVGGKRDPNADADPVPLKNSNGEFIANLPAGMAAVFKRMVLRGGETRDIPFEAQATFAFKSNINNAV